MRSSRTSSVSPESDAKAVIGPPLLRGGEEAVAGLEKGVVRLTENRLCLPGQEVFALDFSLI